MAGGIVLVFGIGRRRILVSSVEAAAATTAAKGALVEHLHKRIEQSTAH